MPSNSRRNFIYQSGKSLLALTAVGTAVTSCNDAEKVSEGSTTPEKLLSPGFIHHVYFWLTNPDSKEDFEKLLEGLRKLAAVKTIQQFHIGVPAATNREVIDGSYNLSWLLFFKNKEEQDSYQTDPVHLQFVEECQSLWKKVVVYDTVDVG